MTDGRVNNAGASTKFDTVWGIIHALVNDPILVMADEPTGSLDSATSA